MRSNHNSDDFKIALTEEPECVETLGIASHLIYQVSLSQAFCTTFFPLVTRDKRFKTILFMTQSGYLFVEGHQFVSTCRGAATRFVEDDYKINRVEMATIILEKYIIDSEFSYTYLNVLQTSRA